MEIQRYKKYVMPEDELKLRLNRIKDYNAYQIEAKQPHHCLTERQLAQQLVDWGHKPERAKGVGFVPPQSKVLEEAAKSGETGGF